MSYTTAEGYRILDGNLAEHRAVASRTLGRPLPKGAVVHHINEVKGDNRPCNLVILNGLGEHRTLHRKMEARKACGHATWRKCTFCKQYDDPENLVISLPWGNVRHSACSNKYNRKRMTQEKKDLYNANRRKLRKDTEWRERDLTTQRARYQENREVLLGEKRAYYKKNRARIIEKVRARYYRKKTQGAK